MTSITVPARLDPRVPFSRADARAAGLAEHLLRTPAYQRLFHDTYLCSSVSVTTEMRAAAAISRTGPGAYASHHTAAELWGVPVPIDGLVHVTTAKLEGRNRRRGVLTHQPLTARGSVAVRHGVRLSRPTQVFCELAAAGVGLVDLVVAGDAMVMKGLATLESLTRAVDGMSGAGVRVARRAVAYVRVGVDSAMESRLRMLLVLAGFPEPEVNAPLTNAAGEWLAEGDLVWRRKRLVGEYQGEHHADRRRRSDDSFRRSLVEDDGWRLKEIWAEDVWPGARRRATLTSFARALDLDLTTLRIA